MMKQVHSAALKSFGSKHEAYDQLRPDFHPVIVSRFLEDLKLTKYGENLTDKKVLELAAGTGKFTRRLVDQGWKGDNLTVVEPSEGMLTSFRKNFPEVNALQGSSYSIPLPDNSVDAVIVAQGFHWFSDKESLLSIKRVLKKNGIFGCIWNFDGVSGAIGPYKDSVSGKVRNPASTALITEDIDETIMEPDNIAFAKEAFGLHEWSNQVAQLAYSYDTEVPQHRHGKWKSVLYEADVFEGIRDENIFFAPSYIKPENVFGYWETRSYISERPQDVKDDLKRKIQEILDKYVTANDKTKINGEEYLVRTMGTHTITSEPN